jgi:hypothetical protein
VQSAGAVVAWQVDTHKTSLLSLLIVNWVLTTISYPLLAVLVFLPVKDEDYSVSFVEDGKEKEFKIAAHQICTEEEKIYIVPIQCVRARLEYASCNLVLCLNVSVILLYLYFKKKC